MPGLWTITVIGVLVLAALAFVLLRMLRTDQIGALVEKRRAGSRLVSRADYVEGGAKLPVALALTGTELVYENPDLEAPASFELARIDEVEYSDELADGHTLDDRQRVMRLRAHGRLFEFVMDRSETARWTQTLPARQGGGPAVPAV